MTSPFSPSTISLPTLSRLLSLYPTTAKNVYRAKLLAKSSKKRAKGPAISKTSDDHGGVEKDVEAFFELDTWRFETLPGILRERLKGGDEDDEGERPAKRAKWSHDAKGMEKDTSSEVFLERDEIVRLMDWKLKHGTFRPALLNLIQSNPEQTVQSSTRAAFTTLPTPPSPSSSSSEKGEDSFPAESLQTLSDSLRGVGPATASLILSVLPTSSSSGIPFFSDELFVWLCQGVYPASASASDSSIPSKFRAAKRGIKYTVKEYRLLFDAVGELRDRVLRSVNSDAGGKEVSFPFSTLDVEKIAFVIGHLEVSGYEGEAEESEQVESFENAEDAVGSEEKEKEVVVDVERRRTRSGTRGGLKK